MSSMNFLLFVFGLLSRLVVTLQSNNHNHDVDKKVIRHFLKNQIAESHGGATLSSSIKDILNSKCTRIPPSTLLLTIATAGQFDLILLQRSSLKSRMHQRSLACLLQRLLIVCLDDLCLKLCAVHRIHQCILFTSEQSLLPPPTQIAKFKERNWNFITYVKWEIINEAKTLGAEAILTFDADLLLFSNPFESFGHFMTDQKYSILHLSETGDGCDAVVNSGMLLLHTSQEKTMRVVSEMLRNKNDILNNTGGLLEQDFLVRAIQKSGATRCSFPRANFTGHCQYAHHDKVLLQHVISYHVPCTKSYSEKIALMTRFLNSMAIASLSNITFNAAELHRNYFNPDHAILDEDRETYPLEFVKMDVLHNANASIEAKREI